MRSIWSESSSSCLTRLVMLLLAGVASMGPASSASAATVNVSMHDNFFSLASLTVNPGDTVVWTNVGANPHTSTSGSSCTADGKWNSGTLSPGGTFSHTFPSSGSYPYFCAIHCHSGMTGTVTVSGASALTCSGSASPTSGTAPLTVAFTGSASGGTSPYTFAWAFGDSASGSGASVSHTYTAAGTFTWTLTVTDSAAATCTSTGTVTVSAAPVPSLFLSTAARATGAQNTNWKTDAMLYNDGSATIHYTLYYTPAGMDGTTTPYVHVGTVAPNAAPVLTNFVEILFGLSNSAGSARFVTDGPLQLSSRTYNDTGSGTYGQWVPGQTAYDAIAPSSTAPAELVGINQDSDYRTNIGFSEIGGLAASVLVNIFDSQNAPLVQDFAVSLQPYAWIQKPLTDFGVASGNNLRVQIVNQGPGTVLGYSSVVDNRTGDAVFVPAQRDADVLGEAHQIIAVAAKATGAFSTNWVTDLYLFNPLTAGQNVTLQFTAPQGSFSASLSLAAHEVREVHDVIGSLFAAAGANASGSLQILSSQGLILVSRTYNQTAGGTYGQLVPEFNSDDPIGVSNITHLLEVSNNATYRCNIGFSEYSGMATTVSASLYDSNGHLVAATSTPVIVPAGGNVQFTLANLFALTGALDSGEVEVQVTGGGSVYPYISVVDNRTGDAIFVPGKK